MTITFDIPLDIEQQLRAEGVDLNREAKAVFLVAMFREQRISHRQLGEALGLDRFETDALLKRRRVFEGALTHEDVDADVRSISELLGPVAPKSPRTR